MRKNAALPGHTCIVPFVPGDGATPPTSTVVMFTAMEAVFSIGQLPSSACTSTFTGEFARSPVQQMRAVAGLVPITLKVEPGNKAVACDTTCSTVPGSASVNSTSTQNASPSHTSMLLPPVRIPPCCSPHPASRVRSRAGDHHEGDVAHHHADQVPVVLVLLHLQHHHVVAAHRGGEDELLAGDGVHRDAGDRQPPVKPGW